MGLDISKSTNAALKKLENQCDVKDYKFGILNNEEFIDFKTQATQLKGISDEDFNQACGLYKSDEAKRESAKLTTKPDNKNLTKEDKKLEKERKNLLVKTIKASTLDTLEDNLKYYNSDASQELVNEIKAVKDFVVSQNFNSKDDVEALKKKISKNVQFSDFQKDLVDEFVELAKKKQIATETAKLVELFNSIKKEYSDTKRTLNYTAMLKDLDAKMKANGLKGKSYYSKEAYEGLKTHLKENLEKEALQKYDEMTPGEKSVSVSGVKKRLKEQYEKDDKFTKNAINEFDLVAGVTKRRLNIERAQKKLETISKKDLISKLGTELFVKLESYLESHKTGDAYNLTGLSEAIRAAIGADEEMNSYEDKRQGEANVAL